MVGLRLWLEMDVVFDTGSADLWIASDLCVTPPCTNPGRHRFNHTMSETFRELPAFMPAHTRYGSGALTGTVAADDVWLGPLVARRQGLGLISSESGDVFSHMAIDGVVGLAFEGLSDMHSLPLFDSLARQNNLPQTFAFFLEPNSGRGVLLWGGVDPRLYSGELIWYPLVEKLFWGVRLVSMKVGELNIKYKPRGRSQPPQLMFDTGFTFFGLPSSMFRAVMKALPSRRCSESKDMPSLVFTMEDTHREPRDVELFPLEYMVSSPVQGPDTCVPGFTELPDSSKPQLIAGDLFMRYYLTVFNREDAAVGLARAREADLDAVLADVNGGTA